jgi:peptidyl-prolyl cis-trans isomerase D
LSLQEAGKLAVQEGQAKLNEIKQGKTDVAWAQPAVVSRQQPGNLPPPVLNRAFQIDTTRLPAYAGVEDAGGFVIVKVNKVIDAPAIDDAKREALIARAREIAGQEELNALVKSLRSGTDVKVKQEALQRKER